MTAANRGLQPERTQLAWSRTALAALALAAILAKAYVNGSGLPALVGAATATLVAAILYAGGWIRSSMAPGCRSEPPYALLRIAGAALVTVAASTALTIGWVYCTNW
jgi:uncharacterized membrane protein YidH (DUF202 family)